MIAVLEKRDKTTVILYGKNRFLLHKPTKIKDHRQGRKTYHFDSNPLIQVLLAR